MSLLRHINKDIIANEIRMERQVRKTAAVLVVEGTDDKKLFSKFLHANCWIREAYGKENVIGIISSLDATDFPGALGIADCDFDSIEGVAYESPNLIFTTEHDVECMMLRSRALSRILIENASDQKLKAFEEREKLTILEVLLREARVIGCFRLISRREALSLDFDKMQFRFVDRDSLKVDVERLVDQLVSRNPPRPISRSDLRHLIEQELRKGHDFWHICSGHDVVEILAIALRRCIATQQSADPILIESQLRLAFAREDLRSTSLFEAVCTWEARQRPFSIFQ